MPHRPTVLFYLLAALLLLAPIPFARAAHHPKPLAAGTTRINPKDRALMVYVPAGPFLMGDVDLATIEVTFPRHTVTLDAFCIYTNDVTVAPYRKFCRATGRPMPGAPEWGWKDDHPVVSGTWQNAKGYCARAGVTLPTEAQWEEAARETDGRKYPWGNSVNASR